MEKDAYNLIDMEKLKNKSSKFISSREALTDIGTIDWDIDQMSDKGWDEYRRILDNLYKPTGLNVFELTGDK